MIKAELLSVYQNWQTAFKSIRGKFPREDIAGPLLMSPSEKFAKQENRLLIVGQETSGWDYYIDDLTAQMKVYEDFNVGERYYSSPFWNVTRKVEKALGNEPYSCAWTNISKFDFDGGRAYGEYEVEISTVDNLLLDEIRILKPKICIFFSGPSFDYRLRRVFKGVSYEQIDGFEPKQLSKLVHPNLPLMSYRTYHPKFLRRSGTEHKFVNFFQTI